VDLSVVFRLSGLPSGAQLELVQASRSPTVVSVALQLPSDSTGPGRRFVQKFSSSTTLWQILRVVETTEKLNFTERALPSTEAGAGRLFYEMPVLNIMNRDLGSFGDLQKTLAQIGVTSGNVLLKLGYKSTETPLEEAVQDISRYFKDDASVAASSSESKKAEPVKQAAASSDETAIKINAASKPEPENQSATQPAEVQPESTSSVTADTPSAPSFTVYSPPTQSAPLATSVAFEESDYVPSVEHAHAHQARLLTSSRNTRLASDKELAAQEAERVSALEAVTSVRVRVRFPDLSLVETELVKGSTQSAQLYTLVRFSLRYQSEPFTLRYVDTTGRIKDVPDQTSIDVVRNLAWRGGTLVTFTWADGASAKAKAEPALNDEALKSAKKMEIPVDGPSDTNKDGGFFGNVLKEVGKTASKIGGAEKEAKLKNLLGFGRKK
jgi:tether containing UBX domain for GLUT4